MLHFYGFSLRLNFSLTALFLTCVIIILHPLCTLFHVLSLEKKPILSRNHVIPCCISDQILMANLHFFILPFIIDLMGYVISCVYKVSFPKCYIFKHLHRKQFSISSDSFHSFILHIQSNLNMETTFSYKKNKSLLFSEVHPDVCVPTLVNTDAQSKYNQIKHFLVSGLGITFRSFPRLLVNFYNIGWESLVVFDDRHIYPSLIAEFYSHMIFHNDETGILNRITTCIQGIEYTVDEQVLINALHIKPTMSSLPRLNPYVTPLHYSVTECINFKQNLAIVTDQLVPAVLFDFPVSIGIEFLPAQSQFLAKIVKQNFMPVRDSGKLLPCDLEMMSCVLNGFMPYNLAYFLLTSFEHCFKNNCMGYGLILSSIFRFLGIDLLSIQSQNINNSNLVSHLNLPPRPLSIFKEPIHDSFESHLNMLSHIESLTSMNQMLLLNQTTMMGQMEEMKQTVHNLKDMIHLLMENQKISLPPFHFCASASSAHPDHVEPTPPDNPLPALGQHFSPINLDEF